MNFVISRSESVRVYQVLVSAPEDSPNTDGIHITESTNVVLQDCKIGTGSNASSFLFISLFCSTYCSFYSSNQEWDDKSQMIGKIQTIAEAVPTMETCILSEIFCTWNVQCSMYIDIVGQHIDRLCLMVILHLVFRGWLHLNCQW